MPKGYLQVANDGRGTIGCLVGVTTGTAWTTPSSGGQTLNAINLYFSGLGNATIDSGWSVQLLNAGWQALQQSWNLAVTSSGQGQVSGLATLPWEDLLPNNINVINAGLIVSMAASGPFDPTSIFLTTLQNQRLTCQLVTHQLP